MTKLLIGLFLMIYRGLPEWFVRIIVFAAVGVVLVLAFFFLSSRPAILEFRKKWTRNKGNRI